MRIREDSDINCMTLEPSKSHEKYLLIFERNKSYYSETLNKFFKVIMCHNEVPQGYSPCLTIIDLQSNRGDRINVYSVLDAREIAQEQI